VARAFRPPAIEELYSAGPHLASYAYEVGNPSLRAERGMGGDLFVRRRSARVDAELTAFVSDMQDFVQYRPLLDPGTGLPERDPRLRRYVVYRAMQGDARFVGVEGTGQWRVTPRSLAELTLSYVRGSDASSAMPLPAMPPLRVRAGGRHDRPRWFAGASAEWSARQGRLPTRPVAAAASCTLATSAGEAELLPAEFCPTPSALLLGGSAGTRWMWGGSVHSLTVTVDNALDAVWRDPLWRAKQVAPQPGRNLKILYRVAR
jgi:iron complex outermembrane receptor protein